MSVNVDSLQAPAATALLPLVALTEITLEWQVGGRESGSQERGRAGGWELAFRRRLAPGLVVPEQPSDYLRASVSLSVTDWGCYD